MAAALSVAHAHLSMELLERLFASYMRGIPRFRTIGSLPPLDGEACEARR